MNGGGKGLFNTLSSTVSGYYDWASLKPRLDKAVEKNAAAGHSPARAAKDILDQSLAASPPLKIWPGGGGSFVKFALAWLPMSMLEKRVMTDRFCYDVTEPA